MEEGWTRGANGRMPGPHRHSRLAKLGGRGQLHSHLGEPSGKGVEEECKRKNGKMGIGLWPDLNQRRAKMFTGRTECWSEIIGEESGEEVKYFVKRMYIVSP